MVFYSYKKGNLTKMKHDDGRMYPELHVLMLSKYQATVVGVLKEKEVK